jgi:hypothetical protein
MSLTPCFRLWECGAVLAGVRAKPCGWCGWPAVTSAPGGAKKQAPGQEGRIGDEGFTGVELGGWVQFQCDFPLFN